MGKLKNILPLQRLLTILKAHGFILGMDTIIRLTKYWNGINNNKDIDREVAKYQMAALICRSENDQELFYNLFDAYLPELQPIEWKSPDKPKSEIPKKESKAPAKMSAATHQPIKKRKSITRESKISFSKGPVLPVLTFPENILKIWSIPQMSPALIPLQEKVWMNTSQWDVPASIIATIRAGGIPNIRYRKRKCAPRYLALIEQESPRDHMAGFGAELIREINRRDLETDFYFYKSTPWRCWKSLPNRRSHVYLEFLKSEWEGARLLLIGDAADYIDPMTGIPSNIAMDIKDSWDEVALLSTQSPLSWGYNERKLNEFFPVIPLSVEGLSTLISQWNGNDRKTPVFWKSKHADPLPPKLTVGRNRSQDDVLIDLYRYLGKEAFQWLCATAVYPEIYYELTAHLHDEAIPTQSDLSEWEQNMIWHTAILAISRLDWYRNGYLPERMRMRLQDLLESKDLAIVDNEIRRILDWSYNTVDEGSYAAAERQEIFGRLAEKLFRVLWIDDHPENNSNFQKNLAQESGIIFKNSKTYGDAVDLLHEPFDLIISDVSKGADGLTAKERIEEIRNGNNRNNNVPIFFYTTARGLNLSGTLIESGAELVTDKRTELQHNIRQLVAKKFDPEFEYEEIETNQEGPKQSTTDEASNVSTPKRISGVITDKKTGEPLPGVGILISGTNTGTTTDIDGRFNLRISQKEFELEVSYSGYKTFNKSYRDTFDINIALDIETRNLFISYKREDSKYLDAMKRHLTPISISHQISIWDDTMIRIGENWVEKMKEQFNITDIFIFLVSPDFLASSDIQEDVEMAVKLSEMGKVRMIPIIIRPCDFSSSPLYKFQALPRNMQPVSEWENQDEAWREISQEIGKAIDNDQQEEVASDRQFWYQLAESMCEVSFNESRMGYGILTQDGYILSAIGVIDNPEQAAQSQVRFLHQEVSLDPSDFMSDQDLGFIRVKIADWGKLSKEGLNNVNLELGQYSTEEPITILSIDSSLQNPVIIQEGNLSSSDARYVYFKLEGRDSPELGSGLFNEAGHLIAIYDDYDMQESALRAIRIAAIMEEIEKSGKEEKGDQRLKLSDKYDSTELKTRIDQIKNLIAKNELKMAIENSMDLVKDTDEYQENQVLMLSARFEDLQKAMDVEMEMAVIPEEESQIDESKIAKSLLFILDEIKFDSLSKDQATKSKKSDKKTFSKQIRNVLSDLYNDISDIRIIAADAGINLAKVPWKGTVEKVWSEVIKEAVKNELLEKIIRLAREEYPKNKKLLEIENEIRGIPSEEIKERSRRKTPDTGIPTIYFSYDWSDGHIDENSSEYLVEEVYTTLVKDGYNVIRGKKDLEYGGLISQDLETNFEDLVLLFLNYDYLKSEYCMTELVDMFRYYIADKELGTRRIFPVTTSEVDLNDPAKVDELFKYWQMELNKWEDLTYRNSDQLTEEQKNHFDQIENIHRNMRGLLSFLKDLNYTPIAELSQDNFSILKDAITDRLGDRPRESSAV